ncbi:ubiquinol-cytochrome-c reductase complex assembly factor 3 [Takifugu rubripes]|uniref:ubiquinol-cytochrome-c reductase complex assembly factor 3 n=1 Tax=Takifugu rubripes TaxID=31033 RepID=UPI001145F809|nr:ubiquinol-cytochrome-c reductase complex assembly factor 3 [Takifugu rubripes]
MSSLRTFVSALGLVGFGGFGYWMWSLIVPGEYRRKELLKNLPESCPSTMEERRKQNALVMQVLKDAAETNENLSRGSWPTRK